MSRSGENKGIASIPDESVIVTTARTTLETEGVAGLSGILPDVLIDRLPKNLHYKNSASKSVKLSKSDDGYTIDIYITVEYDVNIPAVAFELQKNVKKKLKSQFGINVNAVNVRVQGVKSPADYRRT